MAGRKGVETVEPNDYDQSLSSASLNLSVQVLSIPCLQIVLLKDQLIEVFVGVPEGTPLRRTCYAEDVELRMLGAQETS